MSESSNNETSFFGKALEKVGEGIGRGLVTALTGLLVAAGVFGGSVAMSSRNAHQAVKTDWPVQVGQHLQDLVDSNAVFRYKLDEQAKRIQALEDQAKAKTP